MKQNYIRMFAIFASILMLTIVAVPMVAAEDEYCDEAQSPITTDITLYDFCGAEIEIIDGLPFIIIESENECIHMPLHLSDNLEMMADDVSITVEVDGNYLLLPTKYGIERVCISEFDMKVIDEEFLLTAEVNFVFTITISALCIKFLSKYLAGKKTAAGVGAIGGAVVDAAILERL